jgi:hypothetical protein
MMAALKIQEIKNKQNARIKSIIPSEKEVIKNVFGNDQEIPQTIYNRIQKIINKGNSAKAILKIKMPDGSSYWTKNCFEPSIYNKSKKRFTVKTEILNKNEISRTSKLYKSLKRIEDRLSIPQADKFLDGYLEEKYIHFNDLVSL